MLNNEQIAKLVVLSKKGDKEAFQGIYDATSEGLYFTLLKRLGSEQDTQDIMQETYVTAFRTIGRLKNEMACVAWLNRIAYNFSMRYLNEKAKVAQDLSFDDNADSADFCEDYEEFIPESALEKKESRKFISQAINDLPPQLKTALLLFYFEELSAREIAEITDTSETNVFKRLYLARKTIKERFSKLQKKGVTLFTMPPAFTILNTILREEAKLCLSQAAKAAIWSSVSAEIATGAVIGAASAQKIITFQVKSSIVKLMATAAVGTAVVTTAVLYNHTPPPTPQENVALVPQDTAPKPTVPLVPEEATVSASEEPPIPPEPSQLPAAESPSPDGVAQEPPTQHREAEPEEQRERSEQTPPEMIDLVPPRVPTSAMPEPSQESALPLETPQAVVNIPTASATQTPEREGSQGQRKETTVADLDKTLTFIYQVNEGPNQEELIEDIAKLSGNAFGAGHHSLTVLRNDFDISRVGDYSAELRAEGPEGETVTVTAVLQVIDTIAPELTIANPYVSIKAGERPSPEEIAEKAGVSVSDNSREEIIPQISGWNQIHFHKSGEYVLYVEAADSSGNVAEKQIILVRIEPKIIGKAENGE